MRREHLGRCQFKTAKWVGLVAGECEHAVGREKTHVMIASNAVVAVPLLPDPSVNNLLPSMAVFAGLGLVSLLSLKKMILHSQA